MLVIACVGGLGNHVRNMCLLDRSFDLSTVTDKSTVNYLTSEVYTDFRSWHNWIQIEHQFRSLLDPFIAVQHPDYSVDSSWRTQDTVFTTVEPETCYHHYLKFNSNLNVLNKRYFKQLTQRQLDHWCDIADSHDNVTALSIDELFGNEIHSDWLNRLNTAFGINIDLALANEVHAKWQKLNRKAEREVVKHFIKEYPSIDTSD